MTNEQFEAVKKAVHKLVWIEGRGVDDNHVAHMIALAAIEAYEAAKATPYVPADPYGAAYDREHLI